MNSPLPAITLGGVSKSYGEGAASEAVLQGIDLTIYSGEMVAICGPSGSGKSTLLNIIGLLDRAFVGTYYLRGDNVAGICGKAAAALRNQRIGFVFQQFNLLPHLTAAENIAMPMRLARMPSDRMALRVDHLLQSVALSPKHKSYPGQLSGGQRQRVAIARALAMSPDIVVADEPTGALDKKNGQSVAAILREISSSGTTVVLVTHDEDVASHCDRTVHIEDGRIDVS